MAVSGRSKSQSSGSIRFVCTASCIFTNPEYHGIQGNSSKRANVLRHQAQTRRMLEADCVANHACGHYSLLAVEPARWRKSSRCALPVAARGGYLHLVL